MNPKKCKWHCTVQSIVNVTKSERGKGHGLVHAASLAPRYEGVGHFWRYVFLYKTIIYFQMNYHSWMEHTKHNCQTIILISALLTLTRSHSGLFDESNLGSD